MTDSGDKEEIECKRCESVFSDEEGKLIECERCEKWECLDCSGLEEAEYTLLNSRSSTIHWYCTGCNAQAISAVKSDNLIEEKCKSYFEAVRGEISQVKDELDSKIVDMGIELRV